MEAVVGSSASLNARHVDKENDEELRAALAKKDRELREMQYDLKSAREKARNLQKRVDRERAEVEGLESRVSMEEANSLQLGQRQGSLQEENERLKQQLVHKVRIWGDKCYGKMCILLHSLVLLVRRTFFISHNKHNNRWTV
jgi:chromosome segregation ATPase